MSGLKMVYDQFESHGREAKGKRADRVGLSWEALGTWHLLIFLFHISFKASFVV